MLYSAFFLFIFLAFTTLIVFIVVVEMHPLSPTAKMLLDLLKNPDKWELGGNKNTIIYSPDSRIRIWTHNISFEFDGEFVKLSLFDSMKLNVSVKQVEFAIGKRKDYLRFKRANEVLSNLTENPKHLSDEGVIHHYSLSKNRLKGGENGNS